MTAQVDRGQSVDLSEKEEEEVGRTYLIFIKTVKFLSTCKDGSPNSLRVVLTYNRQQENVFSLLLPRSI